MEKSKSLFPKGFFTKIRKEISTKEALKDVVPVNFNNIDKKATSNIAKTDKRITY